jgi:hypothetical protein
MQSREEMSRIWTDWKSLYAPKNFIDDDNSQVLLADFVVTHYGGVPSFTALNAAVVALASQVLTPEPTPAQIEADLAAKANARQRREYLDSLKPQETLEQQKLSQKRIRQTQKAVNEKELKSINSLIDHEINGYVVGHANGHTDYAKTNYGQADLRVVRDKYPRNTLENAKAALSAVRTAKVKL